ncbi:SWIM zinc finger family protein [Streptomyces sp. NPDC006365]|uniref:SWIM zinc finger family protein n=1 Tax=Streptomyces sp. NPDC006365 TaxID=3364744 RepID=UPI00367F4BE8
MSAEPNASAGRDRSAESSTAAEPGRSAQPPHGGVRPDTSSSSGEARPADVARRALWAARRGEAGNAGAAPQEDDSAAPQTRTAARGTEQAAAGTTADRRRTAPREPRPGDVAREALRGATGRGAGAAAHTEGGAATSPPTGDEVPGAAGAEGTVRSQETEGTVRSQETSEPSAVGRPDAGRPGSGRASGTPRPGDVAREALRAARSAGSRTGRTAAGAKGVGGPSRPVDARRTPASEPSPSTAGRRAAAQAPEMADRLSDASEAPPWPAGQARTTRPDESRSTTPSATTPEAAPAPTERHFPPRAAPASAVGSVRRGARTRPTGTQTDADASSSPSTSVPGGALQPHTPPSRPMGSPAHGTDLRRTFPALPSRPPDRDRFAETWWGDAWVRALEEAALDPARLARGRVYAGQGHVDAVTVTPGLVLAYVHGSRPRPYRVQIRMRTLADEDWERFLEAAAERPGHIAALLDKDMPQSLAECGVELLPGPGDLEPHCSCPDYGHPCKHAAALCYQTARLLDEDPFVLLLLRGRGERELLDALSRRNAALAARSAHAGKEGREGKEPELPGVRARDALASRQLPPLPEPLLPPAHPGQPPSYPAAPGGPDPFALDQLATDAATRAHALLTTGRDPAAELTLWQDAVRLAAARPGSGLTATTRALYASLASAAGRTAADLARAVAAWRQGGLEGLAVLEEPWDPPAGRFDRARPLLLAADFPAFRPWHNHLTHPRGHIQLRLGHDGLWYAYESEPGHDDWWPRGTPDLDPVGALTGLGSPTDP